MKLLFSFFLIVILSSCSVLNFNNTVPSPFSVNKVPELVKLGMSIKDISENLKTIPESLGNDNFKFLLKNGELFTRFSSSDKSSGELVLWKTFIITPAGERCLGPDSKSQTLKMMKENPICINVKIVSSVFDQESTGKCYYEQFSPDDIYIRAENDTEQVEMIFYRKKFIFTRGNVPEKKVLKYLTGYILNLNLLQSILGEAMGVAVKEDNGKRSFVIEDKSQPLVILAMNKKAVYPPPWKVEGFFIPVSNKKAYDFSFNLRINLKNTLNKENVIQTTHFKGFFIQKHKSFISDSDISDWNQYSIIYDNKSISILPLPITISSFNDLPE
jgi:hypothetical protein